MQRNLSVVFILVLVLILTSCKHPVLIMVTNTADTGPGSLRYALQNARNDAVIRFDPAVFLQNNPITIYVQSELPHLNVDNLTLDARKVGVILDGSQLDSEWTAGLQIVDSDRVQIMGLHINAFPGPGIAISGDSKQNIIQENLFTNNVIGVDISTPDSKLNTVTDNLIGVDAQGTYWLGNELYGVQIGEGAHSNTIGPDNIIAYNKHGGVYINPPVAGNNNVFDNIIYDNGWLIGWPEAPAIFDYSLSDGTIVGATCPKCTVELYSASEYGAEELGESTLEGVVQADRDGVFSFDKGDAFIGPYLTARTTDLHNKTSYFSFPMTTEDEASLTLQIDNEAPRKQFFLEMPLMLADNYIAGGYDCISFEEDLSDIGLIYLPGYSRANVAISGREPELVDWDKPELDISDEQIEHFTRLADHDIIVTFTLMFWDKENYPDGQGLPCTRFETEEEIEPWLEYVKFTVTALKDYVDAYEIWNEPDIEGYCPKSIELNDYINLVKRTVPVIKDVDPEAKVTVGAVSKTFYSDAKKYLLKLLQSDIMPIVDVVSWHPFYGESPKYDFEKEYYYGYPEFAQEIKDTAAANGFEGEFSATEVGWSLQPGGGQYGEFSIFEANKYLLRAVMLHRGMDINVAVGGGDYYTIRWLNYLMAGVEPTEFPVEIIDCERGNLLIYTFSTAEGNKMIALWSNGIAVDRDPGTKACITIPNTSVSQVSAIDLMNNAVQDLDFEVHEGDVVIRGVRVRDYPLVIKLST